ncbi:MAG TPA: hypothetical protein VI078_04650 [bacterium]
MIDLPGFREIGIVGKECPCCGVEFSKRPGKQRECPSCHNVVYVRLRPLDRQKVLVTEAQTDEISSERRLADAIRWRNALLQSAEKNDIPGCVYWLKLLANTVGSIGMTKESVRLSIAAFILEGDAGLTECCASIHFDQKHRGYHSSELSEDYNAAKDMLRRHLNIEANWEHRENILSTAYLEFIYKISKASEPRPKAPALPCRSIKGVLREYSVYAEDSVPDEVCAGIVHVLEEEGKLPFRNVAQPGTGGALLSIGFGSWQVSTDQMRYEVTSWENMLRIEEVGEPKTL